MHWLNTLDTALFHWVNPTLNNAALDVVMPFLSANVLFAPAVLLAVAGLLWKGGARGRLCVLMLVAAIALGDGVVCNALKELIHRPRPFWTLTDVHMPEGIGRSDSGSMPSSHASNWFAATLVLFVYYRQSVYFMLPMALLIGFSRIYNGVHYPGDVLAGAFVGLGCGAAAMWLLEHAWQWAGRLWFPLWWRRLPSLVNPVVPAAVPVAEADAPLRDQQWLRLGYTLIGLELLINLAYLASGKIGLSGDEAYQWIWSKHLALSYYSKPLLIAVTQFLGTSLWGDNVFGVRFFSPVISAVISVAMLRFLARAANARVAFLLSVILPTVPLFAAGSVLMTVDPLSVLFWTLAMLAGWWAIQDNATLGDWLLVGLWMGLGFLSKQAELAQWLCWALVFALWPPARRQLRRPGPYVALLLSAVFTLPVVIWNAQHHWVMLTHSAEDGGLDRTWPFTVAHLWHGLTHYTIELLGNELALLNPLFFLPAAWAAVAFWPRRREHPLQLYFFCMGAPLMLGAFLLTLHSRVYPNWIVPSVLPLLSLAVLYWEGRWRAGFRGIRCWLCAGLIVGGVTVVIMHDGDILTRIAGRPLPPGANPWRRVEGWEETAQAVQAARQKLAGEGKPVFIIGAHYQITGELTFNLPDAKAAVRDHPFIYFLYSKEPQNQFYFWPSYVDDPARKGQNALFVREYSPDKGELEPPPEELEDEFQSVTSPADFVKIYHEGQLVRRLQIFECRGLR